MPDLTPDEQIVRGKIKEAIEAALQDHSQLVVHWTLTLEAVNSEGVRGTWLLSDDDCKAWDVISHLGYGLALQNAAIIKDILLEGS